MLPTDRSPQQLTAYAVPSTTRVMHVAPERDSIFGNTYGGVPNPMVPHLHPYPTRYHGPVFNYPTPGWGYNVASYARAPFNGVGDGSMSVETKIAIAGVIGSVLGAGLIYLLVRGGK